MNDLMPDFVNELERRLREASVNPASANRGSRTRSARWPVRLALPLAAAFAAAVIAIATSSEHDTPARYGRPLILRTATVDATRLLAEFNQGQSVRLTFGPGARMTAARPVPAFGGTAYVVSGDPGWCLIAPDRAAHDSGNGDPARHSGAVTCARIDSVYRYGIALGVGHDLIAAVPQGVKNPTITTPDGATRELSPSDQGVVSATNLPPGSTLVLHAADDTTETVRVG